jgi:hypothetical protein
MNEKMQNVVGLGLGLGNLDFNLIEATLASIETKSLTPIIKEELKLKIQTQRLASGKSELPTPIFKEPEKCEVYSISHILLYHLNIFNFNFSNHLFFILNPFYQIKRGDLHPLY